MKKKKQKQYSFKNKLCPTCKQTIGRHGNHDIEENRVKTRRHAMDKNGLPEYPDPDYL